jgi:hypothetical protein
MSFTVQTLSKLFPLVGVTALLLGWNNVHWGAANSLTSEPEEVPRWSYNSRPCHEVMSYYIDRGYSKPQSKDTSFGEFKENAYLLQACWDVIHINYSGVLLDHTARAMIPIEYDKEEQSPLSDIRDFYPGLKLPPSNPSNDTSKLPGLLVSKILENENTAQIRAIQHSCRDKSIAQSTLALLPTQDHINRIWYATEMIRHCSMTKEERKRHLKSQWQKHPEAHSFIMLEWWLFNGVLPTNMTPSESSLEKAIHHFASSGT